MPDARNTESPIPAMGSGFQLFVRFDVDVLRNGRMSIPIAIVLKMITSVAEPSTAWASTYTETAQAIADVADDELEAGKLVATAKQESDLDPRALGDCKLDEKGAPIRTISTCRSFGMFQINRMFAPVVELLAPSSAARVAKRLIRISEEKCGSGDNALSFYMTGGARCVPNLTLSRSRVRLAKRLAHEASTK